MIYFIGARYSVCKPSNNQSYQTTIKHLVKRKKRDEEIEKEMVDELLAFYSEDEGGNNKSEFEDLHLQTTIKLTRDNIKAIIMVCSLLLTTINLPFSSSSFYYAIH